MQDGRARYFTKAEFGMQRYATTSRKALLTTAGLMQIEETGGRDWYEPCGAALRGLAVPILTLNLLRIDVYWQRAW